jgi:transcriptional regulator with XRE-family HTH domain
MLIQERIQVILKMHNLSPSAFADTIGVQRSNVSHVLSGRSKPGLDFLEKIIINFPRVNAHWLITGKIGEGNPEQPTLKADQGLSNQPINSGLAHQPEKIIVLYRDGTFKEYFPNAQ